MNVERVALSVERERTLAARTAHTPARSTAAVALWPWLIAGLAAAAVVVLIALGGRWFDLRQKLLYAVGMAIVELGYLPQLVKLYRLKRADEFSLWMPLAAVVGRSLLMTYGLLEGGGARAIGLGFLVGISLRSTLMLQVLYYDWKERRRARMLMYTHSP